jgi:hypothetical protein
MSVIPTLGRLRQEDCELDASLGYTAKPYLRKKKNSGRNKVRRKCGYKRMVTEMHC